MFLYQQKGANKAGFMVQIVTDFKMTIYYVLHEAKNVWYNIGPVFCIQYLGGPTLPTL